MHDADYERWPEEHPVRFVAWLEGRGEPEIAHAVAAHTRDRTGVEAESPLDRALLDRDQMAGFVVACARVRPEVIRSLTPSGVLKKLEDHSFAAKVDREEIRSTIETLGVEPGEDVGMVIEALAGLADELGSVASVGGKGPGLGDAGHG